MERFNEHLHTIVVLCGITMVPFWDWPAVALVVSGLVLAAWHNWLTVTKTDLRKAVEDLTLANNTAVKGLYDQKQKLEEIQMNMDKLLTDSNMKNSVFGGGIR